MPENSEAVDKSLLLQIQNRQRPYEVINLVWDKKNNSFETEGLKNLFGLKEIRIESRNFFQSIEHYAHLLTFLLETMSEAKAFNLPYAYQDEFEFANDKYSLREEGDYRVLRQSGDTLQQGLPVNL